MNKCIASERANLTFILSAFSVFFKMFYFWEKKKTDILKESKTFFCEGIRVLLLPLPHPSLSVTLLVEIPFPDYK